MTDSSRADRADLVTPYSPPALGMTPTGPVADIVAIELAKAGQAAQEAAKIRRPLWERFETRILPWLIAAAVIWLFRAEAHRTQDQLMAVGRQFGVASEAQGNALAGISKLLADQGYVPLAQGPSPLSKDSGLK